MPPEGASKWFERDLLGFSPTEYVRRLRIGEHAYYPRAIPDRRDLRLDPGGAGTPTISTPTARRRPRWNRQDHTALVATGDPA